MKVEEILKKQNVLFDLQGTKKEEVIGEISQKLAHAGFVADAEVFLASVLERETHATTGIGNAIAIPHGKSTTVTESTIVFARTSQYIEWESLDDQPVNLLILLAISDADKTDGHLRLLSEIATKLMDDDIVAALKEATKPEAVLTILSKGDE